METPLAVNCSFAWRLSALTHLENSTVSGWLIDLEFRRHRWSSPKGACRRRLGELLRKEVIQPHLPVRLPCYDLAPIADRTFGTSLPCGLGR